jgi:hypothetical protein
LTSRIDGDGDRTVSISDARFGADAGQVCTDDGPGGVYHPAQPHTRHCLDVPVSGDLLSSLPGTLSRTLATISGNCPDRVLGRRKPGPSPSG